MADTAPPAPAYPPLTHLVLVRHGQSLFNRDGERAGDDSGLTELGWRQSQAVAAWLRDNFRAEVLWSSQLTRARQTAEVIGQVLTLPVSVEQGFEEAEAAYWDELRFRNPDPIASWARDWHPTSKAAPKYCQFRDRIRVAISRLFAEHAGQTAVVVTHGGTIATILRSLFGGHQVMVFTENTGVTHLVFEDGRWRLMTHNLTSHLATLAPPARGEGEPGQTSTSSPWADGKQFDAVASHYGRIARTQLIEPPSPSERELREMVQWTSPRPTDSVLDAGTGSGHLALAFAPHVREVVGIDLSPSMLELAEHARVERGVQNVRFSWGEMTRLELAPGVYTIIASYDLLQYVPEPGLLLARFVKALAGEGRLLLDQLVGSDDPVKRATQETIEVRRDPGFMRLYSAVDVRKMVEAAGFRIAREDRYDVPRELEEWLKRAAADEDTRSTVRRMLEAGMEANATGMGVKTGRNGALAFVQSRIRILAVPGNGQRG